MIRLVPVVLSAIALWAARPAAEAAVFNPEAFTLANGMQVVVVENRRAPVVTHVVWYKTGALDEPAGRSGVAHFLEHLMFKGTETAPDGAFSEIVARLGGRENAFTSRDATGYYQTIAREHLETVMALEADRMTNLIFEDSEIDTERSVVLEERNQRVENSPAALLGEHVNASLYLNHPYRRPIIGWRHEIEGLTQNDLIAFYRRWYAPNNAILVVAGDITAEELRPLAEKHYGSIPAAKPEPRVELTEPPQLAPRRVVLRDERVRQPRWSRAYLAPSYSTGEIEAVDALEMAADVLGGGQTSVLYRELVMNRKLAVAAGVAYDASSRGPSVLTVYALPARGVSMEVLEGAVDEILAGVRERGLDEEDVERARGGMLADAVYARDSLSGGAFALGRALAAGRTIDDVESWPDRVRDLTADKAGAALADVLDMQSSVTALLLPAQEGSTSR